MVKSILAVSREAEQPDKGLFCVDEAVDSVWVPRAVRRYRCACGTWQGLNHIAQCPLQISDGQLQLVLKERLTYLFKTRKVRDWIWTWRTSLR